MKQRARKCLAVMLIAVFSMSTVAYAKVGPDDYYDSYEQKTRYRIGTDIDSGKYVVFNTSDSKNASVTLKRDGENVLSDSFWYNYIVDVESGDTLNIVSGYLVDYDEAKDDIVSSEDGFYEVGEQIDPGTYTVEFIRSSDDTASFTVWTSLDYGDKTAYKSSNLSRGGTSKVTLEDGQYLQLSGCRLTYGEDK